MSLVVDHVNKKCNKTRILLFGTQFNNLIVKLSREFETEYFVFHQKAAFAAAREGRHVFPFRYTTK